MIEREVRELEERVKSGLGDSSLPFKTATKLIVEMSDVSWVLMYRVSMNTVKSIISHVGLITFTHPPIVIYTVGVWSY